jgi:hypothetical protein
MKNPRKVFTPTLLINPSLGLQPAPCTRPEATFWFHRTAAFLHYVATPCYAYFSTALHAIHSTSSNQWKAASLLPQMGLNLSLLEQLQSHYQIVGDWQPNKYDHMIVGCDP